MPNWVIEGLLATSPRPGFQPGWESQVPLDAVASWTEAAKGHGIASIICLIGGDQLPLYRKALPDGLLAHYETSGFTVAHLPAFDGLTHPYTQDQYEEAWQAFQQLPKPVLVHCSAGMDRTGRVVRYILERLREYERYEGPHRGPLHGHPHDIARPHHSGSQPAPRALPHPAHLPPAHGYHPGAPHHG